MGERFWLSDIQWAALAPLLSSFGGKPRVDIIVRFPVRPVERFRSDHGTIGASRHLPHYPMSTHGDECRIGLFAIAERFGSRVNLFTGLSFHF